MAAAEALAQSLREALCELRFTGKSPAWSPTASFGVAEQVDDESLYETMRRADAALYQAKKPGAIVSISLEVLRPHETGYYLPERSRSTARQPMSER